MPSVIVMRAPRGEKSLIPQRNEMFPFPIVITPPNKMRLRELVRFSAGEDELDFKSLVNM